MPREPDWKQKLAGHFNPPKAETDARDRQVEQSMAAAKKFIAEIVMPALTEFAVEVGNHGQVAEVHQSSEVDTATVTVRKEEHGVQREVYRYTVEMNGEMARTLFGCGNDSWSFGFPVQAAFQ